MPTPSAPSRFVSGLTREPDCCLLAIIGARRGPFPTPGILCGGSARSTQAGEIFPPLFLPVWKERRPPRPCGGRKRCSRRPEILFRRLAKRRKNFDAGAERSPTLAPRRIRPRFRRPRVWFRLPYVPPCAGTRCRPALTFLSGKALAFRPDADCQARGGETNSAGLPRRKIFTMKKQLAGMSIARVGAVRSHGLS